MFRAPPRKQHELTLLLTPDHPGSPRQSPALSIPPTHVADYSTKRNTTSQPPDSNRRASRDVRPSSFVVCQQTASIALVFKRAAPDPSALHPFCSGAAPRNRCSATQRVQRYVMGAALHNGCTTARNPNGNIGPQRSTTRHHTPPQQPQHKQQYTRSVSTTPLLFGCSATQRVQHHTTGAAPHGGCSPLTRTPPP